MLLPHVYLAVFIADDENINTLNSPPLAGRAADPFQPYPCKVANPVGAFIEFKLAVRS
jgi:hypothetical protein